MESSDKLFVNKYQPLLFNDFGIDDEIIKILKTLVLMDNLNILLIGDVASGKTSLLNCLIREYYTGYEPKKYEENPPRKEMTKILAKMNFKSIIDFKFHHHSFSVHLLRTTRKWNLF